MIAGCECLSSGTPTAVAAQATYVVTASNSGGSATDHVSITVNDSMSACVFCFPSLLSAVAPSGLAYPTNPVTYVKGLSSPFVPLTHSLTLPRHRNHGQHADFERLSRGRRHHSVRHHSIAARWPLLRRQVRFLHTRLRSHFYVDQHRNHLWHTDSRAIDSNRLQCHGLH